MGTHCSVAVGAEAPSVDDKNRGNNSLRSHVFARSFEVIHEEIPTANAQAVLDLESVQFLHANATTTQVVTDAP
jgi:hypothetical protein